MTATLQPFADVEAIARSTSLHDLTEIVIKDKATFLEVGAALTRIREAKLYKQTHKSWESWLETHWHGSKRHADRQIRALKVAQEFGALGLTRPIPESHARELAKVSREARPEILAEAERALALSGPGGEVTAEHIRHAVAVITGAPADEPKKKKSNQTRRTPQWLFNALSAKFGPFKLDAYASAENALCSKFYTEADDGNAQPWDDVTFGNPEFRDMDPVVSKALLEANDSKRSCILAPAVGSQSWFHEKAIHGTIWMPDCRINFDDEGGNPTGPKHNEPGADRDTVVMTFGGGSRNDFENWKRGIFKVQRLRIAHLRPAKQKEEGTG